MYKLKLAQMSTTVDDAKIPYKLSHAKWQIWFQDIATLPRSTLQPFENGSKITARNLLSVAESRRRATFSLLSPNSSLFRFRGYHHVKVIFSSSHFGCFSSVIFFFFETSLSNTHCMTHRQLFLDKFTVSKPEKQSCLTNVSKAHFHMRNLNEKLKRGGRERGRMENKIFHQQRGTHSQWREIFSLLFLFFGWGK